MVRRSVSDCPASNANAPARSSGTSKVMAAASSQRRSTRATVRVWNAGEARPATRSAVAVELISDLLHVLERLEALGAPVEGLARRGAELGGQLDPRRAAAWTRERPPGGQQRERYRAVAPRCRAGRGEPVCPQGVAAALGDPVARPGGVELDADPHVGVPRVP